MRRPPRDPHEPLFGSWTVGLSLLQGAGVTLVVLTGFALALLRGLGEGETRALTFSTLVVGNVALILTNRSWTRPILATLRIPNRLLWAVVGGALVLLGLVLYVPWLRALFGFAPLAPLDLAVALVAGAASIGWFEALKLVLRR
jgi:Ca2+-transporting ATPase